MMPGQKPRALLSWSTGKDAAWTLHQLRQAGDVDVVGLVTTVHQDSGEVPVHGTPAQLLQAQAHATGLPLIKVPIPWPCPNANYEAAVLNAVLKAKQSLGVTHFAFGDLFLEDIRAYRESLLKQAELTPLFPLWGLPTRPLAEQMIAGGLMAVLTCVDTRCLAASFAGRAFDTTLLKDLPDEVDPCGEEGEFHTFAFDGPTFHRPIAFQMGEITERGGFAVADLLLTRNNGRD